MAIHPRPATTLSTQTISPVERGFFDKIGESFTRGQEGTLARVGVYEALNSSPDNLMGALAVHNKVRKEQALDPIEGNFLADLVYKSSRTTGQMWESLKRGAVGWAIGKAGGAAAGYGIGLLAGGPTGEEPFLGALASKYGGKIGLTIGSAGFAYKEGVGSMYIDMLEQGADPKIAETVARYAGIPYAAIEVLQIKGLTPAIKNKVLSEVSKPILKILGKAALKYGKTLTSETLQEMGQEIVQISAEEIAKSLSGQNIDVDTETIVKHAKRVLEVGKEAVQSFALLPAPGTAIEAGLDITTGDLNADLAKVENVTKEEATLKPEDVSSPINKVKIALDNSLETFQRQQQIRKTERGARFGAGEKAIETIVTNKELISKAKETGLTPNQIIGDIRWAYNNKKTISRFPQKIVDQVSLEQVGNAIKDDVGLKDWTILWKLKPLTNTTREFEFGNVLITDPESKAATIEIAPITGRKLSKGFKKMKKSEAGHRNRIENEMWRHTQGEIKRAILHELGHLAQPSILQNNREISHHKYFQDWVNTKAKELVTTKSSRYPIKETSSEMSKEVKLATGEPLQNWRVAYKRELGGEYSKLGIDPLQNSIPLEIYETLDQELRTTNKISRIEAVKLGDALEDMYRDGKIMPPHIINYARKVWGDSFADTLEQVQEAVKKEPVLIDVIEDYMQAPKALMASMDLSRALRQNVLLIGSPKTWLKAFHTDMKLLISDEKTAQALEKQYQVELDGMGDLVNKSSIRINKWGEEVNFRTGAESFSSRLAKKIPGVQRSERAFSAGGNLIRMNKLKQIAKNRAGKITTDKQWKDIGHVINLLTGEGDPKTFGRFGPILNAAFFAPRLTEARVRAFTDLFNPNLSWAARKILAYHVGSFVGINLGLLGLMSTVPGVEVERDYRSTDFGKIKIGNTRLDFWGGYLPIARLITRLASGEVKTQSGRVIPADRKDTIMTFLQSKLGPVPAYALDLIRGQTFYGDSVGLDATSTLEQFYHRLTPFFFQDLVDAIHYQGLSTGFATAPLGFFGAGVQTYPESKGTQVLKYKNDLAMQVLGQSWDELGPEVQKYMKQEFPEIELKERQSTFDRTNFDFLSKIAQQREQSQKRIYSALPADVKEELDSLNIKPSGVGRTIASDWFLNEKRYKQYEMTTSNMYNKVLTKLVRSNTWKITPPELKVQILTKLMDKIKETIRTQIIADANVHDIQRIQR